MNEYEFKRIVKDELRKLHFNFNYYGTRYLIDAIYETYSQNKLYEINISKDIYPRLEKKYNRSINTITTNIKKSINMMYYDCCEDVIIKYFEYYDMKKPTTKEIIIRVLENIKEMEQFNKSEVEV